ncbi:MAG: hypothetical protein CL917_05325 [Deltaproteobacteria bacterium]|nr:hypothetical protein [Deltaproteobacteria bacterium]
MNERKEQIIGEAIKIVANEGYGKLSMRAVARKSGLKLGALQYHFPLWGDLLKGIAEYIMTKYFGDTELSRQNPISLANQENYAQSHARDGETWPQLRALVKAILKDEAGAELNSETLFPQLWAMAQVEPIMDELMGEIYGQYLDVLERTLVESDVPNPRTHARALVTLLESSILFLHWDKRVKDSLESEGELVFAYVDSLTSARSGD